MNKKKKFGQKRRRSTPPPPPLLIRIELRKLHISVRRCCSALYTVRCGMIRHVEEEEEEGNDEALGAETLH